MDTDITDWLEEGDESDKARQLAEPDTRQFRLDPDAATPAEETAHGDEPTTNASDEDKKKKKNKPKPGKLPPRAQDLTADSREAAADMLKKFFNRR